MNPPPEPSWRKPAGILLILAIITLWCVVVVTVVERLALPFWASSIAYVAGGLLWLWAFPMRRLLRWMELGPGR